jgi:hypothetical protein
VTDAHANFAVSTVATAPSPASSGTSLVVAAGQGALFPTVPFNATVWPVSTQPTTANAEIVRVTNISTDTLTITRAQESSSARTVIVGDQIAATVTAKTLTDVEATAAAAIPNALVDAKGDLLTATANDTPARLAVGSDGQVLAADSTATPGVAWANRQGLRVAAHKTQLYYVPFFGVTGTAALIAQDQVFYAPVWVDAAWTIDRIGVWVTVGGAANSVLRFGLFNTDANGQPGTVVEDFGTVAVDTTAVPSPAFRTVTPSGGNRILAAGTQYWLGVVGQNLASPGTGITMPTVNRLNALQGPAVASNTAAGSLGTGGNYIQGSVTGAFSSATPAVATSAAVPLSMFRTL